MKKTVCFMLVLMLIFLSACTGTENKNADATSARALEDDSVHQLIDEGTLRLCVCDFDTFNPLATRSQAVADCAYLVYDSLF